DIKLNVIDKVVQGMKADGIPFIGTLFAGIMVSPEGEPVVLEFNVRFGDPESQVLMQIIEGDFGEALCLAAKSALRDDVLTTSNRHALCTVLAAANYPASPRKGDVISGLEEAVQIEGVQVYHAGTAWSGSELLTAGGR